MRKTFEAQFTMQNRSGHDPRPIRPWSDHDPTTPETVSQPSRPRGRSSTFGDGPCMEKNRVSCIFYLSKNHFVLDFRQNSSGNSSSSTTCNLIYIVGRILQLQITMEFYRPQTHKKQLKPHLQCGTDPTMMRNQSDHDPTMIRPWSDHDPTMIRPWPDHDPTTPETVSRPSRRAGRSTSFGDGLCMEKYRISFICFSSKNAFRVNFLQTSVGNSSTSTTCNAIYIAGSILQLQITIDFHRQLIQQHHLQPHLHCGNNPAVANHNGILSTTHAWKTLEAPFTMGNRSENWSEDDPNISDHTRDRLATVAPRR